ncbi:MAG: nucleotidyltransferase family protein, partial [Clostridia bacterium]|nr:nucleotidyltransferase family protein [Clostridia bacterium]
MRVAGVIAEYNPFHSGHALHLTSTRAAGCTHIAVVMSGNYTQRGEPAVIGKASRCAAAMSAGADLVLELPLAWATSSAEGFARGGVSLLAALGCVSVLSFGSESGSVDEIRAWAKRLDALEGGEVLKRHLKDGVSFPTARQAAAEELFEGTLPPRGPNDLLAAEYLRAAAALGVE